MPSAVQSRKVNAGSPAHASMSSVSAQADGSALCNVLDVQVVRSGAHPACEHLLQPVVQQNSEPVVLLWRSPAHVHMRRTFATNVPSTTTTKTSCRCLRTHGSPCDTVSLSALGLALAWLRGCHNCHVAFSSLVGHCPTSRLDRTEGVLPLHLAGTDQMGKSMPAQMGSVSLSPSCLFAPCVML